MTNLLNHFLLFVLAGIGMLLVPLLIGRFLRPSLPSEAKDSIYECGEPTIGSSYIQFDLRFYTVALLFIIFDVEIGFFFPWALVYGNAMQLADQGLPGSAREVLSARLLPAPGAGPVSTGCRLTDRSTRGSYRWSSGLDGAGGRPPEVGPEGVALWSPVGGRHRQLHPGP